MFYDVVIDLNDQTSTIIDLTKYKSVTFKNVSDSSIIEIPSNVVNICFEGHLTEYVIPNHILDFCGDNLGLEKLTLNEKLEWLFCRHNKLKSICLTPNLICASLDNNALETITTSGELTAIQSLSLTNNAIHNFDIVLPHDMFEFNIAGNENIRIKYLDFIFNYDEEDKYIISIIDGDYRWVLGNGILMNSEYARTMVAQYCYSGRKYIDLDEVNRRYGP